MGLFRTHRLLKDMSDILGNIRYRLQPEKPVRCEPSCMSTFKVIRLAWGVQLAGDMQRLCTRGMPSQRSLRTMVYMCK